jgi:transcriptional regulator with XRE-family HTH domain
MGTIERIKLLVLERAKSERDFAIKVGIKQSTLNLYILGKSKLSLEAVDLILKAFPDVSAEWLLRGEGNMLKGVAGTIVEEVKNNQFENKDEDKSDRETYLRVIAALLDNVNSLKGRVDGLEKQLKDKNQTEAS